MSRFCKLSHSIWHCQYHIVFAPKYRFKILKGELAREVEKCIRIIAEQKKCKIIELNIQVDHVHLLVMISPKISVSNFVGMIKGKSALNVFSKFKNLKEKKYWGNHFWSRGYCVDTVGLNLDMIRKYIKYQEKREYSY